VVAEEDDHARGGAEVLLRVVPRSVVARRAKELKPVFSDARDERDFVEEDARVLVVVRRLPDHGPRRRRRQQRVRPREREPRGLEGRLRQPHFDGRQVRAVELQDFARARRRVVGRQHRDRVAQALERRERRRVLLRAAVGAQERAERAREVRGHALLPTDGEARH
jgi:hypothetical protein